ncbi:uncharacterized protein LOC133830528 [Humulus lupulus]|uniref:uncharacterized protein LOC133830528 n=1 Tax=Humulus lupulus TaxID=3486 RepID=UPI002B40AC4C|nr:uncharacterized protein LOC133830528 [Humulus lupulus]
MNRSDYRGGDNHTGSDTSIPQSIETPLNSDSSSKSSTSCTPEDCLRRFKRILPRSALYFLREEQFLQQASQSTMRVKKSNRHPKDQDPQVARRAVQKVVERSDARTTTSSGSPSQKFSTVIQNLAIQKPRKGREEEPSWFIAQPSKLNSGSFHKHIEALGLSGVNVICPGPHQRVNRPGGAYCAWSRHHIHAGATLPLHPYFRSIAYYFSVSPFQIAPNGIQALSALYILYFLQGWDEPTPHEVHYLFDFRTNPTHRNTGFFHLYHRQKGIRYLCGIAHKSNPGKYYREYFLTSDIKANNLAFTHAGPFQRPLPTEGMFNRAEALASMSTEEKDVKKLVTVDYLKMVGLIPYDQNMAVESTTGENNTTDQSNAGTEIVTDQFSPGPSPLSHRSGDLVIREPQPEPQHRSAIPARFGKGKAIQIERELSSSSDDEDDFIDQLLNSDSEMFRHCIVPSAPKRKSGEGSGLTPPRKVPRAVPPSQGRQPEGSVTIPQLTPSSLPPSASLTPPGPFGPSEALSAANTKLRGAADQTLRDSSTIQGFESFPRLSVDVFLDRGIAHLTNTLMTFCHAQQRSVDYKELIKVLNDQLVEARAKTDALQSKLEQAEKNVTEQKESLKGLADGNNQLTQANKSLTDRLDGLTRENEGLARENEGLISENEELKQEKEADLTRYEETCFNCFYQVWKLNKPLKLDFLTDEIQAEKLARCEARATEEVANPTGPAPASSTLSFRARGAAEAEEGVDQPTRAARQ